MLKINFCETPVEESWILHLPSKRVATRQQGEIITFPIKGVDGGSISMLTVQVG
jgi:hypothetical protein